MEKKFDLISSMMKRLGVSPRVFVLQCMKGNQLSLNCSVSDETSTIMLKPSNCDVQSHDDEDIVVEPEETTGGHSDVIPPEVEPTFEDVFYEEIGLDDFDEFELNENTQDKVKCGMLVYANGTKFVIRKKPMSSKLMQTNSLEFKGIMFANQVDSFLVIRFGDERCGYKRAVRKLINGYRMLDNSDCVALYVYLNRICDAFKMLHTNVKKMDRIFCLDTTNSDKETPCIFSLKQGSVVSDSDKSASAGFMQVLTIKKL